MRNKRFPWQGAASTQNSFNLPYQKVVKIRGKPDFHDFLYLLQALFSHAVHFERPPIYIILQALARRSPQTAAP